jgi:hypothetical protein
VFSFHENKIPTGKSTGGAGSVRREVQRLGRKFSVAGDVSANNMGRWGKKVKFRGKSPQDRYSEFAFFSDVRSPDSFGFFHMTMRLRIAISSIQADIRFPARIALPACEGSANPGAPTAVFAVRSSGTGSPAKLVRDRMIRDRR